MTRASTYVFFVLCALTSVSIVLAAYCVDLTSGKAKLPGDSTLVQWIKKPTSNGERCNQQGFLKITPPSWTKTVSFQMVFENSMKWSFNIEDSRTNNGHGAEIYSYNNYMKAHRSKVVGVGLITAASSVKTAMLIQLSKKQMYATNYEGWNYYKEDGGLFLLSTMYMGLNRRLKHRDVYGPPGADRTGRGLCSVCISFLDVTVSDLHN